MPKKPERHKSADKFRREVKKVIREAERTYAKRVAREEIKRIKVAILKKTEELLRRHLAQLPDASAFNPAAFFVERGSIVKYALKLFGKIYRERVKGPREKYYFLKEFQRGLIEEKRLLRTVLANILKDKATLLENKRKLSPEEFNINMQNLKEAEAKTKTQLAVAEALLQRAKVIMSKLR